MLAHPCRHSKAALALAARADVVVAVLGDDLKSASEWGDRDSLDLPGLQQILDRIGTQALSLQQPASLTPLGFPLWAERLRGQFSNEDWRTRVQRAAQQLERRHGR